MDIFNVSGNNYQMGFTIGEHFKSYLKFATREFETPLSSCIERIRLLEGKLKSSLPGCLDELYGRADGAGVDKDVMLLYMFPEILGRTDGCTTLTLKTRDNVLFAHNEDDRGFSKDNVALVKYCYDDGFTFAYTMASRMAGSAYAFNSYGLAFSSNYIFGGRLELDNVSRYIILRDVINARSICEVEKKLNAFSAASPFSLNVIDLRTLEAKNFEKDIETLYQFDVQDRFARSNHFVLKDAPLTRVPKNSVFRREKSKELLDALKDESVEALLDILAFEQDEMDNSVFQNPDKYPDKIVTVSNFAVDAKAGRFIVNDFIEKKRYVFDSSATLLDEQNIM